MCHNNTCATPDDKKYAEIEVTDDDDNVSYIVLCKACLVEALEALES